MLQRVITDFKDFYGTITSVNTKDKEITLKDFGESRTVTVIYKKISEIGFSVKELRELSENQTKIEVTQNGFSVLEV